MADDTPKGRVPPVSRGQAMNVGSSFIDLDDGRTLAPGAIADDVNLRHPHNDRLVKAGLLASPVTTPTKEQ